MSSRPHSDAPRHRLEKMRILLTNDDGVGAPGLEALRAALEDGHEVYVVAPSAHCSGSGHALGLYRDIEVERIGERVWSVEGTPADCVKLALREILGFLPDLVVSGINPGPNLANNIHYSGTVAAASEAAFWGCPAIAVSSSSGSPVHFGCAASYVRSMVDSGVRSRIPEGAVLNLNIPDNPSCELGDPVWTRTARFAADAPFTVVEPGRIYRYGRMFELPVHDPEGTDVEAVLGGRVSATLLGLDRTLPGLPPPGPDG